MNFEKYNPPQILNFPGRTWPNKELKKAPLWCSVDLRDGNQSLETPMTLEQKLEFFNFLVKTGFKEIEIGFPAASDTEFQFARKLITENLIPNDVTIQVLTQSREPIIRKTFEALEGVKKAVVHLYNSTSPLQRDVVFNKSRKEVIELAVFGAELLNKLADQYGRDRFVFEYSPESYSQTEPDFAVEICNQVIETWKNREIIINLPFTVETTTPNVHADMVEYMCQNLHNRENIIISLHAHNDRGTAVAATELCLLAGADRVEGTLFGNGERTGNADLITLAMNLYSQGINPLLDFSNIDAAIKIYEDVTGLPVHPRHPYAGDLVFTAFSGSHQDAIRKGMARMKAGQRIWEVPYLPIDPMDVGRNYDPIIRINSQSGRGGVAYILETHGGINMPKIMAQDFGPIVTQVSDTRGAELSPDEICKLFLETYTKQDNPIELLNWNGEQNGENYSIKGRIKWNEKELNIEGHGEGFMEAFCDSIEKAMGKTFTIKHYSQNALDVVSGVHAKAISYVGICENGGKISFGVGISGSITTSSLRAVISAVNRF